MKRANPRAGLALSAKRYFRSNKIANSCVEYKAKVFATAFKKCSNIYLFLLLEERFFDFVEQLNAFQIELFYSIFHKKSAGMR